MDTQHPGGPQYKVHTQKRGQLAGGCRHKNSIDALLRFRCLVYSLKPFQINNTTDGPLIPRSTSTLHTSNLFHARTYQAHRAIKPHRSSIFFTFQLYLSTHTHVYISNVMTHQPNGPLLPISSTSHLHTVERKEKREQPIGRSTPNNTHPSLSKPLLEFSYLGKLYTQFSAYLYMYIPPPPKAIYMYHHLRACAHSHDLQTRKSPNAKVFSFRACMSSTMATSGSPNPNAPKSALRCHKKRVSDILHMYTTHLEFSTSPPTDRSFF